MILALWPLTVHPALAEDKGKRPNASPQENLRDQIEYQQMLIARETQEQQRLKERIEQLQFELDKARQDADMQRYRLMQQGIY